MYYRRQKNRNNHLVSSFSNSRNFSTGWGIAPNFWLNIDKHQKNKWGKFVQFYLSWLKDCANFKMSKSKWCSVSFVRDRLKTKNKTTTEIWLTHLATTYRWLFNYDILSINEWYIKTIIVGLIFEKSLKTNYSTSLFIHCFLLNNYF